jgi:hypothetical protein
MTMQKIGGTMVALALSTALLTSGSAKAYMGAHESVSGHSAIEPGTPNSAEFESLTPDVAASQGSAGRQTYPEYEYAQNPPYMINPFATFDNDLGLTTGRSVANGTRGDFCVTPIETCQLYRPSHVGGNCFCKTPGGRSSGYVAQ